MKKRHLNPTPPVVPYRAALGYNPPPPMRVPPRFIEAMRRITGTEPAVNPAEPKRSEPTRTAAPPSVNKWKSSFKVLGDQEDSPQMQTANSPERTELYDPSSPLSSDSEPEGPRAPPPTHSPPNLEVILPRQHHDSGRWDRESRLPDRLDLVPGSSPAGSRGLSPGFRPAQRPAYSAEAEPLGCTGFGFNSLDKHNHLPPDRTPLQQLGASAEEEGRIVPECRREAAAPPTTSPPRFKRDYLRPLEAVEVDQDLPRTKVTKTEETAAAQSRCPITCDLCDVGVANAQELQAHLDCKSHWDTMQYIQEHNSYDDVTAAFLQEVMLSKSLQCSRAIEDSALTALQENDHMTKVEMFHCAACKLLVPTSGADVKAHITSVDHLRNTKEFEEQQRRACLSKAETLMKELKPQFEHFLNVLKLNGQT
ncbi:DBIRD complex subunit ZNF326 isoform X2 [Oryzias latipes]|uniref:DBIRD complex subunit ZNF326 isoform X2 n=1 Tax=Oryzias latipes TaxID=8090 RepID=UPI0005CC36F0|nr:DBIRD complex subunit ZNF326 isoform X2 [Oryzias latipes]